METQRSHIASLKERLTLTWLTTTVGPLYGIVWPSLASVCAKSLSGGILITFFPPRRMVSFGSYAPLKYRLIAATALKYLFLLTGNYHSLVHMISALGWVLLDNPYYIRGLVDLSVKGPGACGPEVQVLPPIHACLSREDESVEGDDIQEFQHYMYENIIIPLSRAAEASLDKPDIGVSDYVEQDLATFGPRGEEILKLMAKFKSKD